MKATIRFAYGLGRADPLLPPPTPVIEKVIMMAFTQMCAFHLH